MRKEQQKTTTVGSSSGGKCHQKCAGGKECVGNRKYRHVYHLCADSQCICRDYLRRGDTSLK